MRALLILLLLLAASSLHAQTTYTWTGGSGSWFSAAGWSPAGVPGDGDTAVITSGSPVLTRDTTVTVVEFSGASLDGSGHLTVTGSMDWSTGRMNGRDFAETAALTIASGATLRITGDGEKGLRGRDIFNDGTILWEGAGNLIVQASTTLENRTGATFDIRTDARLTRSNGTLNLLNNGLLVKSAGSGFATLEYPFGSLENTGTIRAEVGTLILVNGTSSFNATGDGAFEIADGAVLMFNQATYAFGAGSTVSGAGTLLVAGGIAQIGRAEMTGLTRVTGGSLRLMNPDSPSELAAVTVSGGELGGGAEVNVNGLLTWTGGALGATGGEAGTLNLLGGVEATGADAKRFARGTYANAGLFRWAEGPMEVQNIGTFRNLAGATFSIECDEAWTRSNAFITIVNEGTLVKTGTTGQTTISLPFAPFNNNGEVRVESGTLILNLTTAGSIDTGLYHIAEGAALGLSGATRTLTADASIEGTGVFTFDGDIRFGGTIRPGASPGVLTVGGNWPAMTPTGVLELEVGGTTPGVEYDQIAVSGTAALRGTLRIALVNGFTPALGDRFLIIPASGGATGAFTAVDLPAGIESYVFRSALGAEWVIGTPVANEPGEPLPTALALSPPAPNPTRGVASFWVDLPTPARVRLAIYDALGREVAVRLHADLPPGRHAVPFDASALSPGVYVARLVTPEAALVQRLTVAR